MSHSNKLTHARVDADELAYRKERAENGNYDVPKWVLFCETLMQENFILHLYEARETFSKYITITHADAPNIKYKVRFSNHPPRSDRERMKDCDFFVGKTHAGTYYNTTQALDSVRHYFQKQREVEK